MKYQYPIIKGETVQFKELKLARAKKIALATLEHPYCINDSICFVSREDGAEIILVTFDNEIPDSPINGIQVFEDVAIICYKEDKCFPEVYALRDDFNGGLPHTNARPFEHPVNLCVTEQLFEEVKHKFNAFEFIELIRRWFSLSSEGILHQENQPLESFFYTKGYIIIPANSSPKDFNFLRKIGNSMLYSLSKEPTGEYPFSLISFKADAQVHGFIRREPVRISDLDEVVRLKEVPFSEAVLKLFNDILSRFTASEAFFKCNFAFHCEIPVLRNYKDKSPSGLKNLFFLTQQSYMDIGLKSGCIGEAEGNYSILIPRKFDLNIIKDTPIVLFSPLIDFSPASAALLNNIKPNNLNLLLVGAGALGSQVLSVFSRLGFGKWTVIDHDFMLPHNLAKHALNRKDIGFNKATKISEEVNELLGEEVVKPIEKNFLELVKDKEFDEIIAKPEVIIDMSTSIAVARKISRDIDKESDKPRISAFLNPIGTDLVVLAEDEKRTHRLDFLEMQYYRCIFNEKKLHDHLRINDSDKIRYNRNSCRDITNKINQTDVAIHASICAKSLKKIIEEGNSYLSIWSVNNDTHEVNHFSFEPSKWIVKKLDNWEICIDEWLVQKMIAYRSKKLPKETGGILIGSIDTERNILYLIDTIIAPADSVENSTSFVRGTQGLLEEYNLYQEVTDSQVNYLGEWHSHPQGCSINPSKLDNVLFHYLSEQLEHQGLPVVMCIIGDNGFSLIFKT